MPALISVLITLILLVTNLGLPEPIRIVAIAIVAIIALVVLMSLVPGVGWH